MRDEDRNHEAMYLLATLTDVVLSSGDGYSLLGTTEERPSMSQALPAQVAAAVQVYAQSSAYQYLGTLTQALLLENGDQKDSYRRLPPKDLEESVLGALFASEEYAIREPFDCSRRDLESEQNTGRDHRHRAVRLR